MGFANDLLLEEDLDIERRSTEYLPDIYIQQSDGENIKPEPYHVWVTDGENTMTQKFRTVLNRGKSFPSFNERFSSIPASVAISGIIQPFLSRKIESVREVPKLFVWNILQCDP